jgi:leucyl aminopeptidase
MRSAFVALAIVIGATPAGACPQHDHHYVTIGADAVPAAEELGPVAVQVVEQDADVAVLRVWDLELEELSTKMHEELGRCGGFIVHDSWSDALDAAHQIRHVRPGPGYTIDRDAIVRPVMGALDKANILATIRALSAMPTRRFDSAGGLEAAMWLATQWRGYAAARSDVTVDLIDHGWKQPW